jgi:hypothetical protein
MKSALECYQHAQLCEEQARAARDDRGRRALLQAAKTWRKLGRQAEHKEKGTIPDEYRRPSRPPRTL